MNIPAGALRRKHGYYGLKHRNGEYAWEGFGNIRNHRPVESHQIGLGNRRLPTEGYVRRKYWLSRYHNYDPPKKIGVYP